LEKKKEILSKQGIRNNFDHQIFSKKLQDKIIFGTTRK